MADDRYSWLDENAAEQLLRGDPADALAAIEAADQDALALARRLAAALAAAGDPRTAWETARAAASDGQRPGGFRGELRSESHGELPGEAAALVAFRQARAGSARMGAESGARPAVGTENALSWQTVSLARDTSSRLGQPLRAGLAVALAGCALGGVAFAAVAGVLPTPFGIGGPDPMPGSSVSVAVSPEPGSTGYEVSEGTGNSSRGSGRTGEGERPSEGRSPGETETSPAVPGHRPGPTGTAGSPGGTGTGLPDPDTAEGRKAALEMCREHEAGTLAPGTERRLEREAGGPEELDRYCDGLVGDSTTGGGASSPDSHDDGDPDPGADPSADPEGDPDSDGGEGSGDSGASESGVDAGDDGATGSAESGSGAAGSGSDAGGSAQSQTAANSGPEARSLALEPAKSALLGTAGVLTRTS